MAGDEISASTQYYYKTDITNTGSSNIAENVISSLLAALTGGGSNFLQQKAGNIGSQLSQNGSFGNFVQPLEGTIGSAPNAYLSVLFFDERFNFIPEGSGQLRATDADNSNANLSLLNLKAPKNGYAYIYVSNSSDVSVYFDNLKVAHNRGRIVEENHYYAFGLRIASISSKKLADQTGNEGNTTNSYLYNDKELFEEGDLGWYDYGFRQYDAQIGRFIEIDPLTDDYTLLSGYHNALNDPVNNIDVDGLSSINPMMQMLQCPGVVLHESIKIGLTQAISGLANGVAQNLQQKNTAQQVGQQGGGVLNQSLINTGFSLIPQKPKPADYNNWNSIDKNVFDVLGFKPRNKYTLNDNDAPWMRLAKSQVGIGEKTNHNDGPDVDKYLKTVGLDGSGDPWCGAFVNWGLKESGIKGAQNPAWALDWRNFGQSLSRPAFGSIATMKRPGGGHVGFTAAIDADRPGWIIILGGNQSDQVSYRSFPKRILKFNYPKNFTPSYDLPSMSGIPKGIKMQ